LALCATWTKKLEKGILMSVSMGTVMGNQPKGGPKKWMDNIKEDCSDLGKTHETIHNR